MQDEYLGVIKLFAGLFIPQGYMACNGQVLPISGNEALYSLLGTTYGGNGSSTFALPDLRNRVPAGVSNTLPEGAVIGSQSTVAIGQGVLSVANMPAHTHNAVGVINVNNVAGNSTDPTGNFLGSSGPATDKEYNDSPATGTMNQGAVSISVGSTGNGAPFSVQTSVNVMQPTIGLFYIICTQGVYPPRQ